MAKISDITPNHIKEISAEKMLEMDYLDPSFGDKLGGFSVGANQMKADNINLKSKQTSDKVITIGPNDGEIQDYLDLLNSFGGGTLFLLAGTFSPTKNVSLYTGIHIIGAGRDLTIIDFGGAAYGVNMIGTLATLFKNNKISQLTIQNSNATAGLDIDFADYLTLDNVRVTSCDQNGIRIKNSSSFSMFNNRSDANTGIGFIFQEDSDGTTIDTFTLLNCIADNNTSHGFYFNSDRGITYRMFNFSLINCTADTNGGRGFYFNASTAVRMDSRITNCYAIGNTSNGFDVDSDVQQIYFFGCIPDSNGVDGFNIDGTHCALIACRGNGTNTTLDFDVNGDFNTVIGGNLYDGANLGSSFMDFDPTKAINVIGNSNSGLKINREFIQAKNTSGGSITLGQLVIMNPAAGDPEQVTTTTTVGDNKVLGMCLETSLSNNSVGNFLIKGFTTVLKVNGAVAISIGDFLSCHTSAGIAAKASAGHTVIAIALEAYSTADDLGVIDALVIRPRLI